MLADLHDVDVDAVGLGDLARREGYIERQLKRWTTQWANSKTRELPAIDEVAERLAARIPPQHGVTIAHGDYRFGNCLVDPEHGRIAAVLDWELCTLGDPLADVGYLGVYWTDPGGSGGRHNDPSGAEGFPTYAELLDRYSTRTGRDVPGIDYYVAFASWRLAVIGEGVYARYLHGAMGDQDIGPAELEMFKAGTEQLAAPPSRPSAVSASGVDPHAFAPDDDGDGRVGETTLDRDDLLVGARRRVVDEHHLADRAGDGRGR